MTAIAAWPTDPTVNLAVSALPGGQGNVSVAPDGSGGILVAWQDSRSGSNGSDIYVQRVDADGNALWAANGVLVCSANGNQGLASGPSGDAICSDGAGGAIVAWADPRSGSTSHIYAQRVNSAGVPLWTADGVPICLATPNSQGGARVAPDGAGGACIAWLDGRSGSLDIYVQRVNASGVVQWTANGVGAQFSSPLGGAADNKILSDGSGGAIVGWSAGNTFSGEVYTQRFNAGGVSQWTTGGVVVNPDTVAQQGFRPASDGAGGVIVAYSDFRRGISNTDIYVQHINAAGSRTWGANGVQLIADAAVHDDHGAEVEDGSGGIIVGLRYGVTDIRAQRVDAGGTVQWGANGVIVCAAAGVQDQPRIVATSNGSIISWRDQRSGNNDLYAQRLNASGVPQWTADGVAVSSAPNSQSEASTVPDGADGAILGWTDLRSDAQGDVYAQRITSSGLLGSTPCLQSVTPRDLYSAQGPVGGPFAPSSHTYTVASGATGFSYQVTKSASWLRLNGADQLSGSLAPSSTLPVAVTIHSSANSLGPGVYTDTIVFSEVGDPGCTFTRTVSLTVGTMGISSVSPNVDLTTAFAFSNTDTVVIRGQLFSPASTVSFGGFNAQVFRVAPTSDSIYVILPPYPPGDNCALQTTIPVTVTVTVGSQVATAPSPFVYTIVKARVPEDYPTIQAAVNAAIPGTCISVAAGAYRENVDMSPGNSPRNKVTLMSRTPTSSQKTRIEGGASFTPGLPAVRFDHNDAYTILRGFEIVLGNSGVLVTDTAQVQILDNSIRDNFASGRGGGIAVLSGSNPTVRRNRVDLNEAYGTASDGGGIAVYGARATIIDNNVLSNKAARHGGGIYIETGDPMTLQDVRVFDNSAGGNGGGIASLSRGRVTLDSCDAQRNACDGSGGGIYVNGSFPAQILRSLVLNNASGSDGGGVFVADSSDIWIHGSAIRSNQVTSGNGAGICLTQPAFARIVGNTILGNLQNGYSSRAGGILVPEFTTGEIDSNLISGNRANRGGAMTIDRKSRIAVTRNVIAWNVAEPRGKDDPPVDFHSWAPGIYVFDAGPAIYNNSIDSNTGGDIEQGGGIDGERIGVFQPDWINNIVSRNSGWGIYCRGQNSGARIDYNLGYQNALGSFAPTIQIPGETPFANLPDGNPLFVDPTQAGLNYHLIAVTSPAVDQGDSTFVDGDGRTKDPDGTRWDVGAFYFDHASTASAAEPGPVVTEFSARPNPFKQVLKVQLVARVAGPLDVEVIDLAGRRVASQHLRIQPGTTRLSWDGIGGNGVAVRPGIFFLHMTCPGWEHTAKVVMVE